MDRIPDISVIIVNWNTREYLLDCIRSLKEETKEAVLEIIVADNGSEDGSQDALRQAYPEVSLIENKANLGFSKANNIGINTASGRYICLVNTDIVALDRCLDKMLRYADAHDSVGMIGLRTVGRNRELRKNVRYFPTLRNAMTDYFFIKNLFPRSEALEGRTMRHFDYAATRSVEVMSGCFLMVRREAFEQVGLMDERFFFYGEDTDWCRRMYDAGWDRIFLAEAGAVHYGGGSSRSYPVKFFLAMEKADFQYWMKHRGFAAVAAYWTIKAIHHVVSVLAWSLLFLMKRGDRKAAKQNVTGHAACLGWLLFKKKRS